MGIMIRTAYSLATPDSLKMGEYAEKGFIKDTEYTFKDLVELLERCDYLHGDCAGISNYHTDPTTGTVGAREYFPVSPRDKRYFDKAVLHSGLIERKAYAS